MGEKGGGEKRTAACVMAHHTYLSSDQSLLYYLCALTSAITCSPYEYKQED